MDEFNFLPEPYRSIIGNSAKLGPIGVIAWVVALVLILGFLFLGVGHWCPDGQRHIWCP